MLANVFMPVSEYFSSFRLSGDSLVGFEPMPRGEVAATIPACRQQCIPQPPCCAVPAVRMPLSLPSLPRHRLQTRRIEIEGFLREDGHFDLEASLSDVKDMDYYLASGARPAGEPVHHMRVRLTIDRQFNVVDAVAVTEASPYPGYCETINAAYAGLVGMNLFDGFRKAVVERFGETRGCTHITELLLVLPTAALQTAATLVREDTPFKDKPYPLDRCHALETDKEVVRRYYPKWYRVNTADAEGFGDSSQ